MAVWNHHKHYSHKKAAGRKTINDMGIKELTKVLDREFSLYIRMKAAIDYGLVRCPTCGKWYHWKEMDWSHYISRDRKIVRWNEKNCIAQCRSENRFHSGNIYKMRQVLVKQYGDEAIQEIERLADQPWAEDVFSLRMKIVEYREKNRQLKQEKGL
jgi:hypothetical protein